MTNDVVPYRYPWEPVPLEDRFTLLQRDMAYMVTHTAVQVRSNRPELETTVNMPRGQIIPRGQSTFTGGVTVEFNDIGMPQPGVPTTATIQDLITDTLAAAGRLGLEWQP